MFSIACLALTLARLMSQWSSTCCSYKLCFCTDTLPFYQLPLSSTGRFPGIYHLTFFHLIDSMVSAKNSMEKQRMKESLPLVRLKKTDVTMLNILKFSVQWLARCTVDYVLKKQREKVVKLCCIHNVFTTTQMITLYRGFLLPLQKAVHFICLGDPIHTMSLHNGESRTVYVICSSPSRDHFQSPTLCSSQEQEDIMFSNSLL